jgi:carboxymethylenebutenolidase
VCVPFHAEPPVTPIAGAAVSHELLELEAADGNRLAAFAAVPDGQAIAGVVVIPDVRGLFHFYEELALRFAEEGIAAVAIDVFGRTAGVGRRGEDFPFREHVPQTTAAGVQADVAAGLGHLLAATGDDGLALFVVGFCFGGHHAWLSAADQRIAGAIGFYGKPGRRDENTPGPAERAGELRAPLLALMGGADQSITADDVAAFERALARAGAEHEVVTYPGAPHSFFDRRYEDHAAASQDAWRRTLDFIRVHARV